MRSLKTLKDLTPTRYLPTLNLVSSEIDLATQFEEINTSVLTSKIEAVQQALNNARVRAGSQYMAIESALISATDLKTQYEMGYDIFTTWTFQVRQLSWLGNKFFNRPLLLFWLKPITVSRAFKDANPLKVEILLTNLRAVVIGIKLAMI